MENQLFFDAAVILFLLIFSGFFSGSETAMFSLSLVQRERLKRIGKNTGSLVDTLLRRPRRLIITILIGNDLVNIAASVFAASLFVSIFGTGGKWIAMAVMTPLTLIFAEVIPKTLCVAYNERIAPVISHPLSFFSKFIAPLRWVFYKVAIALIRGLGVEKKTTHASIMEDDFRDMVDISHEVGELKEAERDLIHNVFEFSDTHVYEVMTPAEEIFCLSHDMETVDVIKAIKDNLHSRVPVYRDNPGNIVGILYVKDLLRLDPSKLNRQSKLLPILARKAVFISEAKMVDELFYDLKRKRTHMAICLNKDGRVSGLVTMEDLLEELFGEIYDEYDKEVK